MTDDLIAVQTGSGSELGVHPLAAADHLGVRDRDVALGGRPLSLSISTGRAVAAAVAGWWRWQVVAAAVAGGR